MFTTRSLAAFKAAAPAIVLAAALLPAPASARDYHRSPVGAWYLALDAEPYLGVPGISLPGIAILSADRTMLMADGGDFGGAPFGTRDTAQFGTWIYDPTGIRTVTLFLEADGATGDVRAWFRVSMDLEIRDANTLVGKINVAKLDCVGMAPFSVFNCSDPIEHADAFLPDGPPNVPVTLRRLRVPVH